MGQGGDDGLAIWQKQALGCIAPSALGENTVGRHRRLGGDVDAHGDHEGGGLAGPRLGHADDVARGHHHTYAAI